jgi:hypothetical protein
MRRLNKIILGIPGIPFISVEIQLKAALSYLPVEKMPERGLPELLSIA